MERDPSSLTVPLLTTSLPPNPSASSSLLTSPSEQRDDGPTHATSSSGRGEEERQEENEREGGGRQSETGVEHEMQETQHEEVRGIEWRRAAGSWGSFSIVGSSGGREGGEEGERRAGGERIGGSMSSTALRFVRQLSSRQFLRQQSAIVRDAAAEELEERQSSWAYSRPIIILDTIWNSLFLLAGIVVLLISVNEKPSTPLRVWILGYCLQCLIHIQCVWLEYGRRRNGVGREDRRAQSTRGGMAGELGTEERGVEVAEEAEVVEGVGEIRSTGADTRESNEGGTREGAPEESWAKKLELWNTLFSFVWWVIGFSWLSTSLDSVFLDAPLLSWLCFVFLAFDVFFVFFCMTLAVLVGLAICCCLPCIIAILYAVADQEGASKEDINRLPLYKFQRTTTTPPFLPPSPHPSDDIEAAQRGDEEVGGVGDESVEEGGLLDRLPPGGTLTLVGGSSSEQEQTLTEEDAACCICLSQYEEGSVVRGLPCHHHFHASCVDKWLRTKPTCPLCKFNILENKDSASLPVPSSPEAEIQT